MFLGAFKKFTLYTVFCDYKVVNQAFFQEHFEFAVADGLKLTGKNQLLDDKYQCEGDEEIYKTKADLFFHASHARKD